eukprot:SAG22_NODE_359_length_11758_cov_4.094254_2_plen_181_part_00
MDIRLADDVSEFTETSSKIWSRFLMPLLKVRAVGTVFLPCLRCRSISKPVPFRAVRLVPPFRLPLAAPGRVVRQALRDDGRLQVLEDPGGLLARRRGDHQACHAELQEDGRRHGAKASEQAIKQRSPFLPFLSLPPARLSHRPRTVRSFVARSAVACLPLHFAQSELEGKYKFVHSRVRT